MATKIDYIATLEPIKQILENRQMNAENKNEMALKIINEILKQATTKE